MKKDDFRQDVLGRLKALEEGVAHVNRTGPRPFRRGDPFDAIDRVGRYSVRLSLSTDAPVVSSFYQLLSEKDVAGGYAGIGANCTVNQPAQYIHADVEAARPAAGDAGGEVFFATDTNRLSLWKDTVTLPCVAGGGGVLYQLLSEKNTASGYAGLDVDGIVEKPIEFIRAGTLAGRPVTGIQGQVYFHTDGTQHLTIWK